MNLLWNRWGPRRKASQCMHYPVGVIRTSLSRLVFVIRLHTQRDKIFEKKVADEQSVLGSASGRGWPERKRTRGIESKGSSGDERTKLSQFYSPELVQAIHSKIEQSFLTKNHFQQWRSMSQDLRGTTRGPGRPQKANSIGTM